MTILEADITDLTHDGRGVTHIAGKAVFVAGALAGERVRMRYTGKHRHYDEAASVAAARCSISIRSRRSRRSSACCSKISSASAR